KLRDQAVEQLPGDASDDPAARAKARNAVPPVIERYPQGMLLVPQGQPVTASQFALLEEEHRAFQRSLGAADRARRGGGLLLVFTLLGPRIPLYVAPFQSSLAQSLPKIGAICVLAVLPLMLGVLLSQPPWYRVLVPMTVTAMILTLAYNPQFALLMSFSL